MPGSELPRFTFDSDFAKILYNFGSAMIKDDAHDLGFMSYRSRNSHKYHGVIKPDHPSNLHHWQVGSALVLISQLMALADTASEAMEIADEMEEDKELEDALKDA